jgi:hypothetical protein
MAGASQPRFNFSESVEHHFCGGHLVSDCLAKKTVRRPLPGFGKQAKLVG